MLYGAHWFDVTVPCDQFYFICGLLKEYFSAGETMSNIRNKKTLKEKKNDNIPTDLQSIFSFLFHLILQKNHTHTHTVLYEIQYNMFHVPICILKNKHTCIRNWFSLVLYFRHMFLSFSLFRLLASQFTDTECMSLSAAKCLCLH